MKKTLYLVSLGCPKNLVDSEVILAAFADQGYEAVGNAEEADVLIVNTCGFIRSAAEEAIDEILALADWKKREPAKKLVVAGCLVQRYGAKLAASLPEVDYFVGLDDFPALPSLLEKRGENGGQQLAVWPGPARFLMDSAVPRLLATPFFRAYLKITEGCDNRCAYCMIPAIRGSLRSRPVEDLVVEAQRLEAGGVRELSLIAQDLCAYGQDLGMPDGLPVLLEALLRRTNIPWLRLLYLYPTGLSDALLHLMRANPRIVPYLDLPLQHANDRILKAMHRRYQRQHIEKILTRIRQTLPDCALRTTFMVGFPGESDAEAHELVQAIYDWRLDHVGAFAYEDEEGSAAYQLPGKVGKKEKAARLKALMAAQAEVSALLLKEKLGSIQEVLVEGYSQESDLLLEGRTRFQAPEVDGLVYLNDGQAERGEIVSVRLTEAHVYDWVGEIVNND